MYLQLLKENEKKFFLSLANAVSLLDGILGDEEQQMLDSYCTEMGVSNRLRQEIIPLDNAINSLVNETSLLTKKLLSLSLSVWQCLMEVMIKLKRTLLSHSSTNLV